MVTNTESVFDCRIVVKADMGTSRSSVPATYNNGTETLCNARLQSQENTDINLCIKTPEDTVETIERTLSTKLFGAALPTSKNWRHTYSGNPNRKNAGARTSAIRLKKSVGEKHSGPVHTGK